MTTKQRSADAPAADSSATNRWDRFLLEQQPGIGHKQYCWWSEFMKSRGWDGFGVVAHEGDEICGGANVLVKSFDEDRRFYYVPHGPVLPQCDSDAADLFAQIVDYVDQHRREHSDWRVSHLRIEPRWVTRPTFADQFVEASSWFEPRDTLCIDLRESEQQILAQMKKKGRYNIRLAQRHGVRVVEDKSEQGLEDFMHIYRQTVKRQGIRSHSTNYFRKLAKLLFPHEHGTILFAEHGNRRLAASLMIYGGDTATYKYGGSLEISRHVMAPYLLHFEGMRKAKQRGCDWYDFYGVSPPSVTANAWDKISTFKRKFGGREVTFMPALDLIYDPDLYREFDRRRKAHRL